VIVGEIEGARSRRRLRLVASDAEGTELARVAAASGSSASARRALTAAVGSLLDRALPQIAPVAAPSASVGPVEVPVPSHGPSTTAPSTSGPFGEDPPLVTVMLGGVLRSREISIHSSDGRWHEYGASPYAELTGRIEVRPLAHERSLARGLDAWGEFASALALGGRGADGADLGTQFFRFQANVGYLLPIDSAAELGAGVGFGWDAYLLAPNGSIPGVEYPYLRPVVRGRIRLAGEAAVLTMEAAYRALLSRGALSTAFGTGGDSVGVDLAASIGGALDFGLSYGVEIAWAGFFHTFSDGTMHASGIDGGYRATAMLGFALR
jgi:hypothetical protein